MRFSRDDRQRVLLIDRDSVKRQVRAAALRNCEIEVDLACNLTDANSFWASGPYDLVLLAAEEHSEEAILLCERARKSKPRQRVALLVGPPHYVREVGCEAARRPSQTPVPAARTTSTVFTQPTQWQAMLECLAGTP